jgi:hypothetical protein
MDVEIFKVWQPHEAIPRRVAVTSIRDENEGLCLTLAAEETREALVKLIFQDFVGYRNVNESFRTRTWRSQEMASLSSLLIVERSLWLKWLCEESDGILDEAALTHFAIYSNDDCIDVAARAAPLVVRVLAAV